MKTHLEFLFLLAFVSSSRALAGESPPFGPAPTPPAFEVCRGVFRISGSARPGLGGPLKVEIYLSDVMSRGPVNDEDIRQAFERFVSERYGKPHGGFECRWARTQAEAEQIRDVEFRKGVEGQTFVETGWRYAPPAKAAAPPPAHYAACWAHNNPKVKYYSAVFDGSRDDARQWVPAFEKHLQQKYGFSGPAQCIADRSQAEAQSYLETLLAQDRATRAMDGSPPSIVETGWTY
jgi:hypothetical protein